MALWGTPGTSSLISLVPSENSVCLCHRVLLRPFAPIWVLRSRAVVARA